MDGKFDAFCKEYGLEGKIRFTANDIQVITGADGTPLTDIRTPQDNVRAADKIASVIGELCSDDNSVLHVSIAGGRKTMGFFLGYALSIYGREQDRMSHVLVSEPYENNRDFFYPTQTPREIYHSDGSPLDAPKPKSRLQKFPSSNFVLVCRKICSRETVSIPTPLHKHKQNWHRPFLSCSTSEHVK